MHAKKEAYFPLLPKNLFWESVKQMLKISGQGRSGFHIFSGHRMDKAQGHGM